MAEYPHGKDDAKKKDPKGGWAGMRANAEDVSDKIEPEHVDEFANESTLPPEPLNEDYLALKKAEQDLADAQEANRASLEAREAAVEKLRNLDRIREDARRAMSGEPPLTDEEWEHLKRESSEEKPVDTDVHAENVSRFKSFMRGAVAQLNEIGRGVAQDARAVGVGALHPITSAKELYRGARTNAEKAAAYAAYFAERGRSMDEKLAKLKVDSVKLIENYNALPAHRKLEFTVALAAASGVASGFSAMLSGLLVGAMYTQRAFAGLGFARNLYKDVEKKIAQDAHWLFDENSPTWKKVIYAGALGATYSGATATAAYGLKDFIAHELYGTTPVPEHGGVAAPHAPASEVPQPAEVGAAPAAGAAHETTKAAAEQATQAAPAAPQTAAQLSVEVMKDRGYEQGVWELWKHMHDPTQHFTLPPNTAPDSDLAQLYHADQHTIGGLAHRLAIKHEFFKPGAVMPNDRIVEHSHFSFSSNGEVQIEAPGHEAIVSALDHAAVTPSYHSEAVPAPEQAQLHEVRARLGITEEQQTAELNRMSLEAHQAIDNPPSAPEVPSPVPPLEAYHGGETIQPYPVPPGAEHTVPGAESTAPSAGTAPLEHFKNAVDFAQAHTAEAHIYGGANPHEFLAYGSSQEKQASSIARFFADPGHAKDVVIGKAIDQVSGKEVSVPYFLGSDGKIAIGLPIRKDTGPLGLWGIFRGIFGGSGIKPAPSLDDLRTLVQ